MSGGCLCCWPSAFGHHKAPGVRQQSAAGRLHVGTIKPQGCTSRGQGARLRSACPAQEAWDACWEPLQSEAHATFFQATGHGHREAACGSSSHGVMARVSGIVSEFEGSVCTPARVPRHTALAASRSSRSTGGGGCVAGRAVLC